MKENATATGRWLSNECMKYLIWRINSLLKIVAKVYANIKNHHKYHKLFHGLAGRSWKVFAGCNIAVEVLGIRCKIWSFLIYCSNIELKPTGKRLVQRVFPLNLIYLKIVANFILFKNHHALLTLSIVVATFLTSFEFWGEWTGSSCRNIFQYLRLCVNIINCVE